MKGVYVEVKNVELIELYLKEEKNVNIKRRLLFLKFLNDNYNDLVYSCESFQIKTPTEYEWIRKWNNNGYNGLIDKPITGRPCKLSTDQINKLKELLKEKKHWDTKEIKELIKEKFGIDISLSRLPVILKEKIKLSYSKPYKLDYRRPEDAEEILFNRIKVVYDEIISFGINKDDIVIGFLDEASPQNKANSGKTWHFRNDKFINNSTKIKSNTIGFYSTNGNSVVRFLESTNYETIKWFLDEIRKENYDAEYIILVLDNLSSHKSDHVIEYAKNIGIYLVFLPPYSPDLNPIEFVWKSIKRILSQFFIESPEHLRELIFFSYKIFTESIGFAKRWIEKFIDPIFNNNKKELC